MEKKDFEKLIGSYKKEKDSKKKKELENKILKIMNENIEYHDFKLN